MGNDIVGQKVLASPEVVDMPNQDQENDEVKSNPDIFYDSILTRAQYQKQEEAAKRLTASSSLYLLSQPFVQWIQLQQQPCYLLCCCCC